MRQLFPTILLSSAKATFCAMLSIRPLFALCCLPLVIVSGLGKLPHCLGTTKPYFDFYDLESFNVENRTGALGRLLKLKMDTIIQRSFLRTIISTVSANYFGFRSLIFNHSFRHQPDIIKANGYPVEVHTVETKDGYLLTLHRIPNTPKTGNASSSKIPVLLVHPIFETSHAWIFQGSSKSLGKQSATRSLKLHYSAIKRKYSQRICWPMRTTMYG